MNLNQILVLNIVNNQVFGIILKTCLLIVTMSLIYQCFKIKEKLKIKLSEKYSEINNNNNEYQLYLFFLGSIILIIEITLKILNFRQESLFIINCCIGVSLLILYFLSKKINFLFVNIRITFIIIYLLYYVLIIKNIILYQADIIPVIAFLLCTFFAFSIIKPIRYYWYFMFINLSFITIAAIFGIIASKTTFILSSYSIIIYIINYVQYVTLCNEKNKFLFADEIINNGNSITIAINNSKEITFCSDTILNILGFTSTEVLGLHFWKLTNSEPLQVEIESENRFIVQLLQCKNGEFKNIQWQISRYSSNITICIGQNITSQIQIQNRYKNLIENATDIIFELDLNGKYTYINKYSEKILGYNLEEIYTLHFKDFIRKDYKEKVLEFYNNSILKNEFSTLIFPIVNKAGNTVWISHNVSIKVNEIGEKIGYSAIARDITLLKQIEIDASRKEKKIRKYNDFIKILTAKSYNKINDFESTISFIIKNVAQKVDINRVGFWEYQDDFIICNNQYICNIDAFEKGFVLSKTDYPNYFEKIQSITQIVISDLFSDESSKEFCNNYFKDEKALSLLDTPIYLNGKLIGILCIESTTKIKYWDNEDINFARSISDFIAIAIETNQRILAESKLAYKNEMLSVIAKNTTQFINVNSTEQIISDTLHSIGGFTDVDKLSLFENDEVSKTISQKFRWIKATKSIEIPNPNLQNVPHRIIQEILEEFKEKKYYSRIVSTLQNSELKDTLENLKIKSALYFPINVNKELYGMLVFDDSTKERIWTEEVINILQILVNNLSSAIERNENERTLQESEKRFRLLADNIPGTVYLSNYDENWTKLYLNDEIFNLTGFPKEDFLENNIFYSQLVHPDDFDRLKSEIETSVLSKQKIHSEYRIIKKDGTIAWVEEFGDAIYNDDKIAYIEGIFIDITEKKATENTIREKEYAENANKAKSEFLANMSHEIKTPLNGIIGFTNLLKNTKLEDIQKKYMNTINQSANSLLEIINDILDFSKIESGKLVLDINKHSIPQVADQVVELIKYDSNVRQLQIKIEIEKEVPNYAWIDIVRIKQILVNLLTNAVKFTPSGSVTLSIKLLNQIDDKTSNLRFSVIDTGIGIKEEYQKIIFNAFSQGDNSTTRRFGGTGLGLTISNQLLSIMNSKLQLKSYENKGSTFYFDIAIKTCSKEFQENIVETFTPQVNLLENKFGHENYKILIVEDNKINMLLAKTLVKQILPNSSLFLASNGKEAVEKFDVIFPDLILMDVQMPEMNGYEATIAIRKKDKGKHVPIIALTAGTVMGEKEKCIESGMNDYTSKPIIKDVLETIITKWIDV